MERRKDRRFNPLRRPERQDDASPRKIEALDVNAFKFNHGNYLRAEYQLPRQVGYFSHNEDQNIVFDGSNLKYLQLPKTLDDLRLDLNASYEKAKKNDYSWDPNIDAVLRWILQNKEEVMETNSEPGRKKLLQADVICPRGLLTRVMLTPYSTEGWIICAVRYRGNIYLCDFDTEETEKQRAQITDEQKLFISRGLKFEQLITSDSPSSEPPDPSEPNNEYCKFYLMVQSGLVSQSGNLSFLFCAETDAIKPDCTLQHAQETGLMDGYVELKTSALLEGDGQRNSFCRYKLRNYWVQCAVSGISTLFVGFRDNKGVVRKIREFRTEELPDKARQDLEKLYGSAPTRRAFRPSPSQNKQNPWEPNVCWNFLYIFMTLLKEHVVTDNASVVYKFRWEPGQRISCTELTSEGKYHFLKTWYTSKMDETLTT